MSTLINQARSRVPRIAEAAVERARLTVVPRAATPRARRLPFVALISLMLVVGVGGLLWFNTAMQQTSFEVSAMEHRASTLDARRQGLAMDMDQLRNPQRVALRAKNMGMVPAATPAFIRLGGAPGERHILGVPTPATVEDGIRLNSLPTKRPKNLEPKPLVIRPVDGAATGERTDPAGTKKNR